MVSTSLKARMRAVERGVAPSRSYELVRRVNGSIERFEPGIGDDGVWAVEIDGHLVEPEAGETMHQLCLRAIAEHHRGADMPELEAFYSAVLLTICAAASEPDEVGPPNPVH